MTPYFLLLAAASAAAAEPDSAAPSSPETASSFRPSVAIIVGIFTVMFTLTLLLLIYAKFCHASAEELLGPGMYPAGATAASAASDASRYSGIDKTVIESLPFFPFSSLRGSREGLECAVCLSRFEDAEILRLLPRCKHAFHISCVDRWLEAHSSCPLCRRKVDGAAAAARLSSSSRHPSSRRVDAELFVEREPSGRHGSFREEKVRDEVVLLAEGDGPPPADRFKHRIIVSDVAFRSRWSDVNSSDIMSLRSDMLHAVSSRRLGYMSSPETAPAVAGGGGERVLAIREEMEKKKVLERKARWMSGVDSGEHSDGAGGGASVAFGDRCMSEMTSVSRLRESSGCSEDERVRRVWMPIARRTVRWIAGKERRQPPPAAAAWPRGDERG